MNGKEMTFIGPEISWISTHSHRIPLQIGSTLKLGRGERVIATLAQTLPPDRHTVHVCHLHREEVLADRRGKIGIHSGVINPWKD